MIILSQNFVMIWHGFVESSHILARFWRPAAYHYANPCVTLLAKYVTIIVGQMFLLRDSNSYLMVRSHRSYSVERSRNMSRKFYPDSFLSWNWRELGVGTVVARLIRLHRAAHHLNASNTIVHPIWSILSCYILAIPYRVYFRTLPTNRTLIPGFKDPDNSLYTRRVYCTRKSNRTTALRSRDACTATVLFG